MNIFIGFAVISLVVVYLAVFSTTLSYTTASAYEITDETPFNILINTMTYLRVIP